MEAAGDSTSGGSASQRPSKPPAEKATKTPRSERSAVRGKFTSAWRRNVADRWVIYWRLTSRLPWAEIVARDGRSERTLRGVVEDYLENVQEGDAVRPLERDPVALVESMLAELELMRDTLAAITRTNENDAVVVAAVREWRRLARDVRELLQAVGVLPRELPTLRYTLELREAAKLLSRLLAGLEDGSQTPAAITEHMERWAGVVVTPTDESAAFAAA
jgi:hypothetical protein